MNCCMTGVFYEGCEGERRKYKRTMDNPQNNGDFLVTIPDDLKADIARSVRSIILGGGNCFIERSLVWSSCGGSAFPRSLLSAGSSIVLVLTQYATLFPIVVRAISVR